MIKPLLQDGAFLADVGRAAAEADKLRLWWLDQSGDLAGWRQHYLLLAP